MLANSCSEEKQEKKWLQILACLGESMWRIGVASKERGSGAKCGQEGLYSTLAICRYDGRISYLKFTKDLYCLKRRW